MLCVRCGLPIAPGSSVEFINGTERAHHIEICFHLLQGIQKEIRQPIIMATDESAALANVEAERDQIRDDRDAKQILLNTALEDLKANAAELVKVTKERDQYAAEIVKLGAAAARVG